jgi:hypothetical protein
MESDVGAEGSGGGHCSFSYTVLWQDAVANPGYWVLVSGLKWMK